MKPAIVMQTDFGTDSLSVSSMYGVCHGVDPSLQLYNATHAIREFDVLAASDALIYNLPFWPSGTVFVSVVDPGVGTARRSCVAKLSSGEYVVTPDNGTLTYVKRYFGIDAVREIDETVNRYPTTRDIHIFHGRDVYAYTAARLASGIIDFEGVGPEYPVSEIVEQPFVEAGVNADGSVCGMINEASEHFGLVATNIPFHYLADNGMNYGDRVRIIIENGRQLVYDAVLPLEKSFGFVPVGAELVLSSESSTVMLATNRGHFAGDHSIGCNGGWKLTVKKAQ